MNYTGVMTSSATLQDALATRFLRYTAISSQSDASVSTVPTSQGQWDLARLLEKELLEAGASDVHLSDTCVLTAKLPSNLVAGATAPAVGFCTHLDTVDVSLSPDVKAKIVDYKGGDICLNSELDVWLREAEHPEISRYAGQRVLVTDGTSVLGADTWYGLMRILALITGKSGNIQTLTVRVISLVIRCKKPKAHRLPLLTLRA